MAHSDFPSGFAYLASALRNAGHEVFGLNPNNDPNYGSAYEMLYARICHSLKESQPELIGLGGLCTDFKFLKDAMQIIRTLAPSVPIVMGGGIINNDAEFVFRTLQPDFCIIGEGEEVLVQLVKILESDKQDYEQIANLGYWQEGTPKFTRQNFDYIDIDKRSFPDYEPFGIDEMLDEYSFAARFLYRYTRANPRPMTIVTARGCPFNCTFCVHQRGPKYRARSVGNIMQEIAFLYERYHFNILVILDELFAVNKSRMREFCTALINARETLKWDFEWFFQSHASASLGREELQMAKETGCSFFSYGLESASSKVLASMNKKTKLSQIVEAIENANATKIGFGGNFIFGDVAETPETISETMDFFLHYCLDLHVYLTTVRPYPGSKLFDMCMERGVIRKKLEFYEHIDEGIPNMTSMPDALWLPWAEQASILGNSFPWAKSANAFRYSQELETANNSMLLNSGKLIWRIWVKCPHCNQEVYYREPLGNVAEKQADSFFLTSRFPIFKLPKYLVRKTVSFLVNFKDPIYKLPKQFINKLLAKMVYFFVTSRHPIFKLLEPLTVKETQAPLSFVTGCQHCHKRFRVNIPTTDFES